MYRKSPKGWLKHWDFIILELISFQISFLVVCMLRFQTLNVFQIESYRIMSVIIFFVDAFTIFFFDSFRGVLKRGIYQEYRATLKHNFIVIAVCALVLFAFKRGEEISRLSILVAGVINALITYFIRIGQKKILKKILASRMYKTILIITSKDKVSDIVQTFSNKDYNTHHVVGLVLTDDDSMVGEEVGGLKVVCTLEEAPDYAGREWVDEVLLVARPQEDDVARIWKKLSETGITIHLSLSELSFIDNRPMIAQQFAGMPVLTTSIRYASTKQFIMKRLMDLFGGIVGSLFAILLMFVFGPIIFIASPGNIFFTQERIGRNGKKFRIIKFRTMYKDAEKRKKELMEQNNIKDGLMFKMDFDPRIIGNRILPDGTKKTGIGQFMRNHSIDEFPQFFNVLMGQMSLVGTRPPTPDEWEKYKLHHRARLAIKPGVTGLWQVSGRSSITDFEEVVKLDTEYISTWSIGGDLRIIIKTIGVVFTGDGAK